MKAFIAAVLGGIGIIPGAMLGGILIGLIEIFRQAVCPPGWYEAVTYGTLIVILLVKPSGILGKNVGEKRVREREQNDESDGWPPTA